MNYTEITITCPDEAAAERNLGLFRDMVKLYYADKKGSILPAEADGKSLTLSEKFFRYRPLVRDYEPKEDFPYCPLPFLERKDNQVILTRCADLQLTMNFTFEPRMDEFFIQLCEAAILEEPDTSFEAECLVEETVSGTKQISKANYGNREFHLVVGWELEGEYDEMKWEETDNLTWIVTEE